MSKDETAPKIEMYYCAERPIVPCEYERNGHVFHSPVKLYKNLSHVMASQDGPVEVFEVQIVSRGFFRRKYEIERCDPPERVAIEKEVEKIFEDVDDI